MSCEKPWSGKLLKAVAVDVYNQTIDGDVACAVTAAVGGQTQVEQKSCACTLKIRGGATGIVTARKPERVR